MPRVTGIYERTTVGGESVDAFVPFALPPAKPPLRLGAEAQERLALAEGALRGLELAGEMVPSLDWFLYAFVRKEAVVSSQIEGTQASLVDLVEFEARGTAVAGDADVHEVCNYIDALAYARGQLGSGTGLPLTMRLLNGTHERLMRGARGEDKLPGQVRTSQNWIGGTRPGDAMFVPPPPHALAEALSSLEKYMHVPGDLAPLVRAGLLHVQFETIHPYLDGNGRIGRLLVTLLLEHWKLLSEPLLYLSLYFKRHREEYYRRLGAVRTEGDWEGWTLYFLTGVATIANESVQSARDLFALIRADRERVLAVASSSVMSLRLFEVLPAHPVVTVARAMKILDTTRPTAAKAVNTLVKAGVLAETTGQKRDRLFAYAAYLDLLKAETEP